jgi:hypothetical protein
MHTTYGHQILLSLQMGRTRPCDIRPNRHVDQHGTKALQPILFHRHTDFLLGHVPTMYSPLYESIVSAFTNHSIDLDLYVPKSFTTLITAAAARIYAPTLHDYQHSPWLSILGHGQYNPIFPQPSSFGHNELGGGVIGIVGNY